VTAPLRKILDPPMCISVNGKIMQVKKTGLGYAVRVRVKKRSRLI